ncbi:MAG: small subunit ribosomal protein S21 [Urechidicola sp.]|jgi:small subunit ribosomal protein S21|tara:strand:- start:4570 stop:4761 length:192 start_codon:yes stop_codon:yes gene_type:complete
MLVVQVKEGENIERALKRYKNKFNRTKIVRQLRDRKQYIKPTVANRKTKLKAVYIQAKYGLDS